MGRWKQYLNSTSHNASVASRQMGEFVDYQLGQPGLSRDLQINSLPTSLGRLLEENEFDVVHAHFSTRYGHILSAVPDGIRKVLSVWGEDVLEEAKADSESRRKLESGLDIADYITTTSKHMKDTLVREYGVDEKNIWTITWGYTGHFHPRDTACDQDKLTDFGIMPKDKVYLSARVCRPNNNIEQLINGFSKSGVDAKLAVLAGNLQDRQYRASLENMTAGNDNILFLPTVCEEDLSILYNRAEAILSLPYVDQLSTTVLESLACGTPVIGSRIQVYKERITDGVNGCFVDPDNIKEISRAIKTMDGKKAGMKNAAVESVKNDSWEKNAREMLKVYDIPKDTYNTFI